MILYFPFLEGEGTRPYDETIYREPVDYAAFDVYWNNRLVPQSSIVKGLPFFPTVKRLADAEHLKIPLTWNLRVKGFLFLDGSFKQISNNKLKLTVNPSFDAWMNDIPRYKNEFLCKPAVKFFDSIFIK